MHTHGTLTHTIMHGTPPSMAAYGLRNHVRYERLVARQQRVRATLDRREQLSVSDDATLDDLHEIGVRSGTWDGLTE